MNKISIAFIIDTIDCDTAGTQKQLIQILDRIDRKVFDPFLICLWSSPWMEKNRLPCRTFVLDYKGLVKFDFVRILKRFSSLMREHRFDILHTFFMDSIFVTFFAAMLSRRKPLLLSSRRDIGLAEDTPWYHGLYEILLPFVNLGFKGIIANCEEVRKHIIKKEKLAGDKVKVIYNGIEIRGNGLKEIQPDGIGRSGLCIAVVANLTPVKRVDVFLKGLALLMATEPNCRPNAVILGDGPEKERLVMLAETLGITDSVRFCGAVKNVEDYLRHTDFAVLCSDREGLSNSIMECMACSLPIVATVVGGNIELVDEKNGFLVPPGNPEALAFAMAALCGNEEMRKRKGAGSFEKVRSGYSWEKSMSELESYYLELLDKQIY